MKQIIEKMIGLLPRVGKWREVFLQHSVPGHWGSPVPDWTEMAAKHDKLFTAEKQLHGIDMNNAGQIERCKSIAQYVPAFYEQYVKQPVAENLFALENNIYYRYYDGANLFGFLRHFRPARIIEIGSGYSSALMLDTNKKYFDDAIELTFIEPNPERLLSLVPDKNSIRLIKSNIQEVDKKIFEALGENDFLFVDSSHVAKMGSDLNTILFDILPLLKKGVMIHFHDISFPFEYPRQVIDNRMAWNEVYFLQAFLMYNTVFAVEFMNSYLAIKNRELFYNTFRAGFDLPDWDLNYGGSCWLRKQV